MSDLKPCPFCGGEAELEQTGKLELTIRCVGVQPSGLRGCGPKYTQKITLNRFSLEWLGERMAENWNRRAPSALEAELAKAREAALEEAAKVADTIAEDDVGNTDGEIWIAGRIATAIRALQDKEAKG